MIRLFKIEWLKIKSTKSFWIMCGLFVFCYLVIGFASFYGYHKIHEISANSGQEVDWLQEFGIPLFDWMDIWQNITYISHGFKYFLAFIVISSVTNEYSDRTIRQNIMDGLSTREWLGTKVITVAIMSIAAGALCFLLGSILGFAFSPVSGISYMFANIEFIAAFIFEVFAFLILAMLFALIIKRTGFTIVLFTTLTSFIDLIIWAVGTFHYKINMEWLPFHSIHDLIQVPIQRYALQPIQDSIATGDVAIALCWTAFFLWACDYKLRKSDIS